MNDPSLKLKIDLFMCAVRHFPKLPKSVKYEGRKKVRGYNRKMRSVKNDKKRFFEQLPVSAISFFADAMDNIVIPKISNSSSINKII